MAANATTTTDHAAIRRWAEARGGRPARVKGSAASGDPAMLRLDFPGYSGQESLEEITWTEWFDRFERHRLALLHSTEPPGNRAARFNRLVSRGADRARPGGRERPGPPTGGANRSGPKRGGPTRGGPQRGGPKRGGPKRGGPKRGGKPSGGRGRRAR